MSEIDEARLRSCLDEIRNVIGDSVSEASIADIILANEFDVAKSLDAALSNASDDTRKPSKMKKQGVYSALLPMPSESSSFQFTSVFFLL